MKVLAMDTSGRDTSAAIHDDRGLLACAGSTRPRAHASELTALIQQCVDSCGLRVGDITHVAVARGPGLFTGLRVGLVTAEVFAAVRELPLAGIGTLEALARRVRDQHSPVRPFAVVADARRREVYWQIFDPALESLAGPAVGPPMDLITPGGPLAPYATSGEVFGAAALLGGDNGHDVAEDRLAAEVAAVAAARFRDGTEGQGTYSAVTPLYLRRPDVSMPAAVKSVLASAPKEDV